MTKIKVRFIDIIYCLAIIGADIFIYIVFGLLLMGYDDSYDTSKGEYWSWTSMTFNEKLISVGLQTWNIINIAVLIYIGYRIYKRIKYGT